MTKLQRLKTLLLVVSLAFFLSTSVAHDLQHDHSASVDCDVCLVFGGVAPGAASTGELPIVGGAAVLEPRPIPLRVSASVVIPPSRAPPA